MLTFLDIECTTHNKGNPFDERNKLVCVGWHTDTGDRGIWFAGDSKGRLEEVLSGSETWVFFNAKFDLHWLRKCGFERASKVFCTQLGEFFLSRQSSPYPSLDRTATSYGIGGKFDRVKSEFWDKGVDTDQIPRPVLTEYCLQDIEITKQIYYKQQERITPKNRNLISLQMQDLLVLEDIEWNGLYFNPEKVKEKEDALTKEIADVQAQLNIYHSIPNFNWGSPRQLSALLYGGTIDEDKRIPVGVYKTGEKVGQPRFKVEVITHTLPRMYNPPRGSETKTAGVWSTDEDTLLKIKGGKKDLIQRLLKVRELSKLQSTYVKGLRETHMEMHWPANYLHGQYNQVVAATGRLSSTNPNMQNMPDTVTDIFETRFV